MSSNQQWFWLCRNRKRTQAPTEQKWGLVQHDRTMLMYRSLQKNKK